MPFNGVTTERATGGWLSRLQHPPPPTAPIKSTLYGHINKAGWSYNVHTTHWCPAIPTVQIVSKSFVVKSRMPHHNWWKLWVDIWLVLDNSHSANHAETTWVPWPEKQLCYSSPTCIVNYKVSLNVNSKFKDVCVDLLTFLFISVTTRLLIL